MRNTDAQGIWSGQPGALSLVAISGSPVAASPGDTFDGIRGLDAEQGGPLEFAAVFGKQNTDGEFVNLNGTQEIIVQDNTPAPGTSGGFAFFPPVIDLNQSGQYSFAGEVPSGAPGGGNLNGIWANGGSGLQLMALQGAQVPGMSASTTWQSFNRPEIGPDGTTTFFATLSNNQRGMFSVINGTVTTLAEGSTSAFPPQVASEQPHVNSVGDITFDGDSGVVLKDTNGIHVVAQTGTAIVGGGILSSAGDGYAARDGHVVFLGTGANIGQNGIYKMSTSDSAATPIAVPGQAMPGLPQGWTLDTVTAMQVNGLGQVAFEANLFDPSNNEKYNYIFGTDPQGNLLLVAGPGTVLNPPGSITLHVTAANMYMGTDVGFNEFNDAGEFTFEVTSQESNSTLVVADLPEPNRLGLIALAALAIVSRRKFGWCEGSRSRLLGWQ
jgi:hypothetical protein